ncbi:MAG: B12-binding domain-containing radical SAM protein, partial [Candidatus Omnitrophica bacterium]|nr:B12-binding domain-containing radical SAM protein [Candidatus Omnitrophota bacterium]
MSEKRYRLRVVIPAYPAFNIYSNFADKTTALGPVSLASVINEMEGWDVEVIDENNLRRFGPRSDLRGADHEFLQTQRPADIVGLYGGLTSTIPRLYEIAHFYKSKNKDIITISGGQHFVQETIPEALNSNIDYIVIGEGEQTIKELIKVLQKGLDVSSVKGIAYLKKGKIVFTPPREQISDFQSLPLPNFSLVRYAKIKVFPVERIRGCGMNCEFCTVKGKPRCASPERLLEQISFIVETQGASHFFIVDDLFGQQREETIRFCQMLRDYQKNIRKRLDFNVQIRLDKAIDSGLLKAMREASINMVAIGYESPIKEELKAMKKNIKPEDMISLTNIFSKFGFMVHGMFIFGYPLEKGVDFNMTTNERMKRYRQFIKKAKIDTFQVLLPVPLPGTQLRERLMQKNIIYPLKDVGWEYYDGNFPLFEPDEPMTAEQNLHAVRRLMKGFYQFKYMF